MRTPDLTSGRVDLRIRRRASPPTVSTVDDEIVDPGSQRQSVAEQDDALQRHLESGERPFAYRASAGLSLFGAAEVPTGEGVVYVTDRRLLHIGSRSTAIRLSAIVELTVTETRLLITLRGHGGVALVLDQPQVLRGVIVAAKAAPKGDALDDTESVELSPLPETAV